MSVFLDIELKHVDKVYYEGDNLTGLIHIKTPTDLKHEDITMFVEGSVNLQLSGKNVGVFEAFYNSVKPIQLISYSASVLSPGKMPAGSTKIPFKLPLKPNTNRTLYETYHGVFVNISYSIKCEMKRGFLAKDVIKSVPFIVQDKGKPKVPLAPLNFTIHPDSLKNIRNRSNIPKFRIVGALDTTICDISKPFKGKLVVEMCDVPIKSIELQLVRVETCGCAEGYSKDATEIQNIQIGEGDVPRNLEIPIFMIFPRLFTCPTLSTPNFKIEFEINIVIIFQNEHLVTENFPILLTRMEE